MIERRIDPEPATVAELDPTGEVPELEASVPKRISA
jgi:hypothetical protein